MDINKLFPDIEEDIFFGLIDEYHKHFPKDRVVKANPYLLGVNPVSFINFVSTFKEEIGKDI